MKRGLTTEQAQRGVSPTPLTRVEWGALWRESPLAEAEAHHRKPEFYRRYDQEQLEKKNGGVGG